MSVTDELLESNRAYASTFDRGELPRAAARKIVVLTCMDARLDPMAMLGLELGDAHVLRNAGGTVTDDAIRSIMISQRLQQTKEIVIIHHTGCGMLTFSDDELRSQIEADTGLRPPFALESFRDLEGDVRQSIARVKASPFIPDRSSVRGFVYEVESGRLREVV